MLYKAYFCLHDKLWKNCGGQNEGVTLHKNWNDTLYSLLLSYMLCARRARTNLWQDKYTLDCAVSLYKNNVACGVIRTSRYLHFVFRHRMKAQWRVPCGGRLGSDDWSIPAFMGKSWRVCKTAGYFFWYKQQDVNLCGISTRAGIQPGSKKSCCDRRAVECKGRENRFPARPAVANSAKTTMC